MRDGGGGGLPGGAEPGGGAGGVRGVVFLDNAPFHRSRAFREAAGRWRERGLEVAYLPRYSPHLNPVEGCGGG